MPHWRLSGRWKRALPSHRLNLLWRMVRNNGPAARDKSARFGWPLVRAVDGPGPAAFFAAIELVVDPEFAAHPFPQQENSPEEINDAAGEPKHPSGGHLILMGDGKGRGSIQSGRGEFDKESQKADTQPGRRNIKQGFGRRQTV